MTSVDIDRRHSESSLYTLPLGRDHSSAPAQIHTQPGTNFSTPLFPGLANSLQEQLPVLFSSQESLSQLHVQRSGTTTPPIFELPSSYDREFRVKKDLGAGYFGQTALVEVIVAEPGGKADNLRLRPGQTAVVKRVTVKPSREPYIYRAEWWATNAVQGHESIVRAFGARDPAEGDPAPAGHIFMEYCNLGDVDRLLRRYRDKAQAGNHLIGGISSRGAPPEGFAFEMMMNIANGLAWIHYGIREFRDRMLPADWETIIHNDIKPDNIFMTSRAPGDPCIYPIFKIADFGGATNLSSIASVGSTVTSSPERVTSLFSIPSTPRDDIFSLGATMYYVAHGRQPFSKTEFIHAVYTPCGICGGVPTGPPPQCREVGVRHQKMLPLDPASVWSGCGVYSIPDYAVRRLMARSMMPYGHWWHDLVEDCIEVERQDRPDAVDVAQSLFMARRGYGEGVGGIREILWDTPWLGPEERQSALTDIART
ncbi:G2-specific serine/threonine protein kinase [Orbilia brochopaga]|uniref:non-specific serine/threonine protein kinase n=1 Tax=Orbilia brochopaga TaxID=3140254 RepID=A0AAV9UF18_9PEZI